MPSVSLQELAELVGGQLDGDPAIQIQRAAPITEAQAGDITFLTDDKPAPMIQQTGASAVIVEKDFADNSKPLIRVADPLESFLLICRHLHPPKPRRVVGVHAASCVDPTATLAPDCNVFQFASVGEGAAIGPETDIGAGSYIGARCRIGSGVLIHPNVTIYDDTIIGDRVIIHSGTAIGTDGFGFRLRDGRHEKIPQMGHVEIGDDVEIGSCTTIDRATFGVTSIGRGTKIDNQVMIAHNCRIGEHCLIVSQVGLAGSCKLGDYVVLAGQVGVVDHTSIGDKAVIGAQSGVTKNVPAGEIVLGSPAAPAKDTKRVWMSLTRLPELKVRIRKLEQRLGKLEDQGDP